MSADSAAGTPLRVRPLGPADAAGWDAFVRAHPEGTFFHLCGWARVLEDAFGHRTHYLLAERPGGAGAPARIAGVLPLAHLRSVLFGNALISLPFAVYGGAVAADPDAERALVDAACALARELRVDYLELRNRRHGALDWPTKSLYVTFRKTLEPSEEANLKAIPRKQRAMVRKGIDAGLRSEIDAGIDRLYAAYSESVRNLGTPVFGASYFRMLCEVFGEACEVLTVTHQDRPVASVMSFYFRDEVLPYYGGGTAAARDLKANDFMYWELMRRACARGIRVFDYGRSKRGTGSFAFKEHWGFTPEDLHYQYYLVRARSVPDVSPSNPKYQLFIRAWQRLPLPVTRMIGPMIARSLG